jgi:hypothetical protein
MNKKRKKQKGSSRSQKDTAKKEEEIDLSEYEVPDEDDAMEEAFEDSESDETKDDDEINLDEYEVPDGFIIEDKKEEEKDPSEMNWFQRKANDIKEMDSYQRLYWIKILIAVIGGTLLGLLGAKTGWWLIMVIGLYAGLTAVGYYLFKLDWNFKEVVFSGFFPYIALFWLFWTLMFTSLYFPESQNWLQLLETVQTVNQTTTTYITTITNTTSAAAFPFVELLLTVILTIGALDFFLRRKRSKNKKNDT